MNTIETLDDGFEHSNLALRYEVTRLSYRTSYETPLRPVSIPVILNCLSLLIEYHFKRLWGRRDLLCLELGDAGAQGGEFGLDIGRHSGG